MQMSQRDWFMLILLSILWGGSFFFVAVAVKEMSPLAVVFVRVFLAALCLGAYLWWRGGLQPLSFHLAKAFLVMGFFNNVVPFSLIFWAQTSIPSGLASILNATTPIFSLVIAHFALSDEKMQINKLMGVLLGLLGVAVLIGWQDVWAQSQQSQSSGGEQGQLLPIFACLLAAASYGIAVVYGRRFKQMGITASMLALGQLSAASIWMLPVVLIVVQPWTLSMPGMAVWLSLLGLAVASTAFAYLLYFKILENAGAVNAALVTLLIPASAILLGYLVLDEQLQSQHYAGLALISLGLVVIDGRLFSSLLPNGSKKAL